MLWTFLFYYANVKLNNILGECNLMSNCFDFDYFCFGGGFLLLLVEIFKI